jgi:thioredoxin 1
MSDKTINLSSDNFKTVITSAATPVLVDFWAPWCGPCKAIAPILEEIADELAGKLRVGKVNVDDNQDLAAEYQVRAIPTMLLFKNGAVVETFVGMSPKAVLKEKISAKL